MQRKLTIKENLTLDQVEADIKAGRSTMIYWSTRTCWWTHLASDLKEATADGKALIRATKERLPVGDKKIGLINLFINSPVPNDPTGATCYQMDKPWEWIISARAKSSIYGPFRLRTFMASHHQNSFDEDGHHYAAKGFVFYTRAIENLELNEDG